MGSVTLHSGVPKEGVFVEARSETKGFYEEATTDNLGNFCLRGLLPDTTYLIRAVAKENLGAVAIERASPEYVAVNVGSEDIKGVDFVVFEQPKITILSGHVEGSDLDVLGRSIYPFEIRSSNDPSKIAVGHFLWPLSSYFEELTPAPVFCYPSVPQYAEI
ncbi:Nodal modulator 1 [Ananas comosus]|uniref:Nodal modulator 1 n=1 Tax=Ananas comosus TaxID=4615 RepID=A0A199VU56_ANACO|nr:Nodal modulator 1 [Ananas comosus]